jgi:hypothetical protein
VKIYCTAGQATDDNIIRRMRVACWITKATDTHTKYVILIAFPRQQWLHESTSMLRYAYIASLIICYIFYEVSPRRSEILGNPDPPPPPLYSPDDGETTVLQIHFTSSLGNREMKEGMGSLRPVSHSAFRQDMNNPRFTS